MLCLAGKGWAEPGIKQQVLSLVSDRWPYAQREGQDQWVEPYNRERVPIVGFEVVVWVVWIKYDFAMPGAR